MLRTLNKKHQITENSEPPKPPPEILKTSAQSSSQKSRGIGTFEPKTIPRDIVDPKKTERRAEKVGINVSQPPPDYGRTVWITDATDGFRAARIIDLSATGFTLRLLDNTGDTVTRVFEDVLACEDDSRRHVEDNCQLMHLNEATLLNNIRLRYQNGKIYSYVANILISINPYQTIDGFYSLQKIKEYRGKSLGQKEPHIFAIADKSYREMIRHRKSQSIIVSGESGAGKTESQKAVLRYLCENWGSGAGEIQKRLLETNPILEAFGNAKTLRNNNSSRFGKFVQIHFADTGNVAGGYVSHYLLETSRICRQAAGERNYHIFYQLIAGSSPELFKFLALGQPNQFNYLKRGFIGFFTHPSSGTTSKIPKNRLSDPKFTQDSMVDDFSDFQRLEYALKLTGLSEQEIHFIWTTIAAILHLGNVEFEESLDDSRGGCKVFNGSEQDLIQAARLLGLETMELKMGLCARIMQTTKGGARGTLIRVPLKPHEACSGRDALSKAIYSKLFDWLVSRINDSIPFEKSTNFVGVLDVAGFEFYAKNSFEQFCINFCNEKLQNFFNQRILREEQELYEKEGLNVRKIEFIDNQDCIELFELKGNGLFDLLDEEAKFPTSNYKSFTKRAHEENRKHFRLDTPRKSKVKSHRELRDDEGLLIRHYAGSVCYETKHFVEKNDDLLHNSLQILIEQSTIRLLVSLFGSTAYPTKSKLKALSVGAKFKNQLSTLLIKLESTGTHFVRCIKPNNQMIPFEFDGSAILSQLQCAGMTSVLKLMQDGFPSRTGFGDLYACYQKKLPPKLSKLDPRMFCKCLFRALGLDQHDFQFGLTKVFFRAGKFAEFDQMMKQDPETMTSLIQKVNEWLVGARWKQSQYAVWSVIKLKNKIAWRSAQVTRLQSIARGYLTRQRFSRQIALYRKSVALLKNSKEIEKILFRLNEHSRAKYTSSAHSTIRDLEKLVSHIKLTTSANDHFEKAENAYEHYVKRVDSMIADLKKQQKSDELAEIERKRRESEEKERLEIEAKKEAERQREIKRKLEEQQQNAQKEHENYLISEIHKAAEETEKKRQNEEKEKLDKMVSNRLAEADGVALISSKMEIEPSSGSATFRDGKYDVGGCSFAYLRDTINTSMDINLLKACEEEFRRRLRIYNEWKSRNAPVQDRPPARAALSTVCEELSIMRSIATPSAPQIQRYFKCEFKENNQKDQVSMWFVHFSGQQIQRQLTFTSSRPPQTLIAGRDDAQMCTLALQETLLVGKRGAEISEDEFESHWKLGCLN
ncbi:Myosin motor domain-containing protein [Caenorhabditis elegans]|uniref:Myosin motor domain-containing protein n=1 Tax=Caenorhabditis elegans TaxID=6239 RepID=H2L0I7_CAEEL|nr:Myosin motor domain-containing protein [Caenorhabditis elegans]CCD73149.2 Myosin motor domain-containing protein [Caenorhabditis elegans]|eukprot:NP_001023548.2 Heavy chain, Unconventional Myosin [Caenorhabditis elegans]